MIRLLLATVLAATTCACQPTGVRVCDRNLAALVTAEAEGYRYDCTPTEVNMPPWVLGWADHDNRVLYVRPDTPKITTKVMWHELGHAVVENRGLVFPSQSAEERWADGYAWCHDGQQGGGAGISYQTKPTDCAPYLI